MISLVKIDGISYDTTVVAIQETYNVVEGLNTGTSLYKNREIRDIHGIKIGHNITFAPDNNTDAFDALCAYLFGTVREYVMLEVVHDQTTIKYEAAYNTGSRMVNYINDNKDYIGWADLTVEFRPMECQITTI